MLACHIHTATFICINFLPSFLRIVGSDITTHNFEAATTMPFYTIEGPDVHNARSQSEQYAICVCYPRLSVLQNVF